ncbi:MAG: glycosyltransferase family 2 protein [Deltaproteobacteria bacterium]|nr:glycosyltransferase family 2 protein [Deltaproteobacteria bacterium]
MAKLDIVIPVYNEGKNIVAVLEGLRQAVRTPFHVLICYDFDEDDTLTALREYQPAGFDLDLVKNRGLGPHGAVCSGFAASTAAAVLVFPADDVYNAGIIDPMVRQFEAGCDIVAASRFMPGGCMEGCPWLKATLVRLGAFTLHHFAGIPTRDASNGFRMFSRQVLQQISIESTQGFTYSLELLVKCHRLGWRIGEVPARWFERPAGGSRFRVLKWLPAYLRWYGYAFATRLGRRRVALRAENNGAAATPPSA